MTPDPDSAVSPDAFDLARFLQAQADSYAQVLHELCAGQKRSHWMWFVFPQFAGLGASATSQRYAIKSLAEAQAYLCHPLLGARLIECTKILNSLSGRSARQVFGAPDDLKFCSCMTLFELALAPNSRPNSEFTRALEKYFSGKRDVNSERLVLLAGSQKSVGD